MKKAWISFALVISLLLGTASPVLAAPVIPSQADDSAAEFRRTIVPLVREKLGIEEEGYRFSLSSYLNPEGTVYYLTWEKGNKEVSSYISASVDEKGSILNAYLNSTYVPEPALPRFASFSDEELLDLAHKKLSALAPEMVNQLRDPRIVRYGVSEVAVVYTQYIDDIPLANSDTRIVMNIHTGEAVHYVLGDVYDLNAHKAPTSAKNIDMQAAKQAFRDAIGLRLVYTANYRWNSFTGQREGATVSLRYAWNDQTTNYINAETGELYTPPDYYSYAARATAKEEMSNDASYASGGGMYDSLTPGEIERLQSLEGVMSPEEAEKALRKLTQLDLPADDVLVGARYYRDINDSTERMALSFSGETHSANADINAKTGEVYSFNAWDYNRDRSEERVLSNAELNTVAQAFIEANTPGRYSHLDIYTSPYMRSTNTVQYVRMENGIPFMDDTVQFSLDPSSKKITSFWQQWNPDLVFPEPKGIVSLEEAYERFFTLQEPVLSYLRIIRFDDEKATYGNYPWDLQSVYTVPWLYISLDAFSNTLMQYETVYMENALEVAYDDLQDHPDAEKIMAVARYIGNASEAKFRPDEVMTQGEFAQLFASISANPARGIAMNEDDVFTYLSAMGLLRVEDWAPEKELTLLDAAKCMVRILGYDSLAHMGIRVLNPHNLSSEDATYLAIASGTQAFDLAEGVPNALLSRAEGMVLLYNILAR